jgi:hypothetical protein
MTAIFVLGRNQFRDNGITASLGGKAFGFAWGSVGCLLAASLGFCCVAAMPSRRREYNHDTRTGRSWRRRNRPAKPEAETVPTTNYTRTGRFWRGRNRPAKPEPEAVAATY